MNYRFNNRTKKNALLLLTILILLPHEKSLAEKADAKIYKNQDSRGVIEYSSSANDPKQKPVKLPELMKAAENNSELNSDSEILTCNNQGGVDCGRGKVPGQDSAYCFSGEIAKAVKFDDSCVNASLKQQFFVEFADSKDLVPHYKVFKNLRKIDARPISAFVVELRNNSAIEANVDGLYLKLPFLIPRKTTFNGPKSVTKYGLAIYRLQLNELPLGATDRHLAEAKIQLDCSNCKNSLNVIENSR